MRDDERYRRAKARVEAQRGFYAHASIFGLVNGGLLLLNLLTSPAYPWFLWPLLGWGLALAAHALGVFGRRAGEGWEGRQIRRRLERGENPRPDEAPAETWPDLLPGKER